MKKYNFTVSAACPPEMRWKWVQELHNKYILTFSDRWVMLEGIDRTEEDFAKIQYLIREFPDHHITVKEVENNGEETRQASLAVSSQGVQQWVHARIEAALVLCDRNPSGNASRSDTRGCSEYTCAIWSRCQKRIRASSNA